VRFDSRKSTSFKQLENTLSSLRYGRGAVEGFDTNDEVCLNKDSTPGHGCMSDYLWKAVVYQKDLEGLAANGIIGLAPSSQHAGS